MRNPQFLLVCEASGTVNVTLEQEPTQVWRRERGGRGEGEGRERGGRGEGEGREVGYQI